MAQSSNEKKWDVSLMDEAFHGQKSEGRNGKSGQKDQPQNQKNQKVHYLDQVDLSATPEITFEPRPVVIPFPKTLYGKESESLTQDNQNEVDVDQVIKEKLPLHQDAKIDLKSVRFRALAYGIPVAIISFFLGIKIGIACMKSTHGSSLEILLEALKF
jgi:hypothetical protein